MVYKDVQKKKTAEEVECELCLNAKEKSYKQ
jgi:hypothetical protein